MRVFLFLFFFDPFKILRREVGALFECLERARVVGIPHGGTDALSVSCMLLRAMMRHDLELIEVKQSRATTGIVDR